MSAKLLTICHCERNEVDEPKPRAEGVAGSNLKDSAITTLREAATASTLRYRSVPCGKAYAYVMTSV